MIRNMNEIKHINNQRRKKKMNKKTAKKSYNNNIFDFVKFYLSSDQVYCEKTIS